MQTLPSPQCCPTALRLPGHSSLHRSVGCLGCLPQLSSKPPCLQGRERISVTGEEWPQRQRRDRTSWGSSIQQQGRGQGGHAGGRGGLPAGLKGGRRREGKEARERSSPFLLAAPKNILLYNQKRAPDISHLCFFILSFGDQGGSHTEKRGAAVPEAAPRHEVLQDEQAGKNITKNIV